MVLQYWQKTPIEKVIVKGEVRYEDFLKGDSELMPSIARGRDPWKYTLEVTWVGMSHTSRVVLRSLVRPGTDGIKIGLMTRVF